MAIISKTNIVKYRGGTAYYFVAAQHEDKITVQHALSGDQFPSTKAGLIEVPWNSIPKSYQLDILSFNPSLKETKGNNTMFEQNEFMPRLEGNEVMLSPKGIAIRHVTKSRTKYRVFDAKANTLIDVTGMTMDIGNMLFLVPTKTLKAGDVVIIDDEPAFVKEVTEDGQTTLLGATGLVQERIETKSMFGFDFYHKVATPFKDTSMGGIMKFQMMQSMMGGGASSEAMNPMMLMMMGGGKGSDDLFDFDNLFDFDK